MKLAACRLGFALLTVALVGGAANAQTVSLRPKFEVGEETRYRMAMRSSTAGGLPGAADPAELKQLMEQTIGLKMKTVATDPEGSSTVEMVYESIKFSLDSAMMKTTFDSTKPKTADGDDPVAAVMRSIVGTTMTVVFDRDGNITSVKGGESLAAAAGGMGGLVGGLTNAGQVRELFNNIFTIKRAKGSAEVGEKWKTEDAVDVGPLGKFTMTTESKLVRASGGRADVEFVGTITPGPESAGAGVQIKDSAYTGSYVWDTRRGCLESMKSDQKIAIEGDVGGMKLSSKSDIKMEVTRVK